jgi:oxygen-independent coproporphyrinogen-3 oxidase
MPASAIEERTPAAADADPGADTGFGIYVHWPFCLSKCPYCDFNSHVADAIDHGRWRRALLAELDYFRAPTAARRVTSVFFGGGTPSLMQPETAAAVIDAVRRGWPVADDLEITLEANPSSVEAGRFRALGDAGVNRLSLGVQSFDDAALKFLGRGHSAADARKAIRIAADAFGRYSFDLIYALPGQTADDWQRQLAEALPLAGTHLSCYQLTIEPGTPFHRDRVEAAGEEAGAGLFETTRDRLALAGLPAYEVSNHAAPGQECRHNLYIWRGADYLGVGPGAHGRLSGDGGMAEAHHRIHAPERWLARVEAQGHGTAKTTALSPEARAEELVMTGLRLAEGISRRRFRARAGRDLESALDPDGLGQMIAGGFVEADDESIRVTAQGRLVLNAVLGKLLVGDAVP